MAEVQLLHTTGVVQWLCCVSLGQDAAAAATDKINVFKTNCILKSLKFEFQNN